MANPVVPRFSLGNIRFPFSAVVRIIKSRPRLMEAFHELQMHPTFKDGMSRLFSDLTTTGQSNPKAAKLQDRDVRSFLHGREDTSGSVGILNSFGKQCGLFTIESEGVRQCHRFNMESIVIELANFGDVNQQVRTILENMLFCGQCQSLRRIRRFPSALLVSYPNGAGQYQVNLNDINLTHLRMQEGPTVLYHCVAILKIDEDDNCSLVVRNGNIDWPMGWMEFQGNNGQVVQAPEMAFQSTAKKIVAVYEKLH